MNRIDCQTCERMGRVTVILTSGKLTTTSCGNCGGQGWHYECFDPDCRYCVAASAGMLPSREMFAWGLRETFA